MNWTVIWLDATINQIAAFTIQVWGTDASAAITQAMVRIELFLKRDPGNAGESRASHRRILFESPLIVGFEVHDEERTVIVTRVQYHPPRDNQ